MRELLGGAILSLAVACSSGGGGAHPRPPGPGSAPDAAVPVAVAPGPGPTERECDALIAHAVALGAAQLARDLPGDQLPTDAEQAALRTELRGRFLAECRGGTRRGYDCAIAARSLAELAGCQGPPQAIRKSSTSNSSVAPGGILPPAAPRSP